MSSSQVHGGDIKCTSCGAAQTPEAIGRGACQYCNAVLPHRVAAAKQAEAVKQMMADLNGNGIPDMFEPQVANMQRNMQVNVGYGPGGSVVVASSVAMGPGVIVHSQGPVPIHPYAAMHQHADGVAKATSTAMIVVFVMLGLGLLLALGGAGAAFYLLSGG